MINKTKQNIVLFIFSFFLIFLSTFTFATSLPENVLAAKFATQYQAKNVVVTKQAGLISVTAEVPKAKLSELNEKIDSNLFVVMGDFQDQSKSFSRVTFDIADLTCTCTGGGCSNCDCWNCGCCSP